MRHYSCDVCGRGMQPAEDDHFVVKMQAYLAAPCQSLSDSDVGGSEYGEDDDTIELPAMNDGLGNLEEMLIEAADEAPTPTFKEFRFDLCQTCHRKFLADPMNREAFKFQFSNN